MAETNLPGVLNRGPVETRISPENLAEAVKAAAAAKAVVRSQGGRAMFDEPPR